MNDRDREHGRKGKDLFLLKRAVSFGRKGHVRRTYMRSLRNTRYVDGWIPKLVLPDKSSK